MVKNGRLTMRIRNILFLLSLMTISFQAQCSKNKAANLARRMAKMAQDRNALAATVKDQFKKKIEEKRAGLTQMKKNGQSLIQSSKGNPGLRNSCLKIIGAETCANLGRNPMPSVTDVAVAAFKSTCKFLKNQ